MKGNDQFSSQIKKDPTAPSRDLQRDGNPESLNQHVTRRGFVATIGVLTGGAYLSQPLRGRGGTLVEDVHQASTGAVSLKLNVNGQQHNISIDPRVTLLDLLREGFGLTGTKKGCDHGQCGSCTVLANRRRINSCLSLAVAHDGDEIITVEGLAKGNELHPVQSAFVEHDGFQCGYCTPGQICSAVALFDEHERGNASFVTQNLSATIAVDLTPEEIRERMSGNICRCGAYPGIVAAVQDVHRKNGKTRA